MNASSHFTKLHNLEFLCCQPHSRHSTVGTRQFFHALCPFEAGLWASGVLPLPSFILWVSQNLFPWLADGYLLATSTHSCPSVCTCIPGVSLCVQISSSYKDTSHTELRLILKPHFNLKISLKTLFLNMIWTYSEVLGVRT